VVSDDYQSLSGRIRSQYSKQAMLPNARVMVISLVVAVAAAGCHKKPVATRPAPRRVNTDSLVREQARLDSIARADAARAAAAAAAAAGPATAAPVTAGERATIANTIYFDLDESALGDESRAALEAKAPIILRHPSMRVRITGHADARGSDEYNLALGLRRAAEAKRYLAALGIDESRIEIVTMGEEKPAVQGDTEEAYALNRRAEFEIIS
jgi:peptidoglycan-associated lipoprotein